MCIVYPACVCSMSICVHVYVYVYVYVHVYVYVYVRMCLRMYATRSINRTRVSKKRYCFLTHSTKTHGFGLLPPSSFNMCTCICVCACVCACVCVCVCAYVFTYVCHAIYQSDTGVQQKVLFFYKRSRKRCKTIAPPRPQKTMLSGSIFFLKAPGQKSKPVQHCISGGWGRRGCVKKQYLLLDTRVRLDRSRGIHT